MRPGPVASEQTVGEHRPDAVSSGRLGESLPPGVGGHVVDAVAALRENGLHARALVEFVMGSSSLSVYRDLICRHCEGDLGFSGVPAFLLDEYVGLPPSHPQSYAHVIRVELADHLDIDSADVHGPVGYPVGTMPGSSTASTRCLVM